MKRNNNILICPLEWGLGHAARMIPLANELLKRNQKVFFASGEEHLNLLRSELPGCTCINFPGFKPGYSGFLPQYISVFLKIPLLIYHIILEHHRLKKLIREYSIDIVISDNRFGLWNKGIKTVYVTHMPLIPFPRKLKFLEPAGVIIHRWVIKKYDWCLIPDLPGEVNLSGRLSHGLKLPDNVRYTGILSRFSNITGDTDNTFNLRHNTIILSGPEPQKEILKNKLINIFIEREPATFLLEGKPGFEETAVSKGNIILYNHLTALKMAGIIRKSEGVISRSGYSTVMDLIALGCKGLLIPTPGQTEQEYLAEYLSEKSFFLYIPQHELSKEISIPMNSISVSSFFNEQSRIQLKETMDEILNYPD